MIAINQLFIKDNFKKVRANYRGRFFPSQPADPGLNIAACIAQTKIKSNTYVVIRVS